MCHHGFKLLWETGGHWGVGVPLWRCTCLIFVDVWIMKHALSMLCTENVTCVFLKASTGQTLWHYLCWKEHQPLGNCSGMVCNSGGASWCHVFTQPASQPGVVHEPSDVYVSSVNAFSGRRGPLGEPWLLCCQKIDVQCLVKFLSEPTSTPSTVEAMVPQTKLDHWGQPSLALCITKSWLPMTLSLDHQPSLFGPLLIDGILLQNVAWYIFQMLWWRD